MSLLALLALLPLLLAYAWVDGGREDVHEITQEITVSGAQQ